MVALTASQSARAVDIGREPLATGSMGAPGPEAQAPAPSARRDASVAARAAPRRRWYGWQTLIADGASAVVLIAYAGQSSSSNRDAWILPVTSMYLAGPPIIHVAHGHAGKAVLSLGIRAAGPLMILAALPSGTGSARGDGEILLAVAGVLAIPAAIAVDAAAVAREDVPGDHAASLVHRLGFAPWFDPLHGAGGLSLALEL